MPGESRRVARVRASVALLVFFAFSSSFADRWMKSCFSCDAAFVFRVAAFLSLRDEALLRSVGLSLRT